MALVSTSAAERMLQTALMAVRAGGDELRQELDGLPVPVYLTDANGVITHYNHACIGFAGRRPRVGQDTWCVTWKLYTEAGQFLPHDQCPMAIAIHERRSVRGAGAVAERPDGSRAGFLAYPTPLFDEQGQLVGALNMLIDLTAAKQARALREKAARYHRLAGDMTDERTIGILRSMAAEYQARAQEVEDGGPHADRP